MIYVQPCCLFWVVVFLFFSLLHHYSSWPTRRIEHPLKHKLHLHNWLDFAEEEPGARRRARPIWASLLSNMFYGWEYIYRRLSSGQHAPRRGVPRLGRGKPPALLFWIIYGRRSNSFLVRKLDDFLPGRLGGDAGIWTRPLPFDQWSLNHSNV